MILGALTNYNKDYTNCISSCDFHRTDKTARLSYDNNACILACNKYYTLLRKQNIPSHPITKDPYVFSRSFCHHIQHVSEKLSCQEKYFRLFHCFENCENNKGLMSNYDYNRCINRCRC